MTFGESIKTCVSKLYLPLQGRASRSEFWWFALFSVLSSLVFFMIIAAIIGALGLSFDPNSPNFGAAGAIGFGMLIIIYIIGIFFFVIVGMGALAATVRRLHDRNMSGWWYVGYLAVSVIPFVNFIAFIALIVILCLKGTNGPNKYGSDPLGLTGSEVFE